MNNSDSSVVAAACVDLNVAPEEVLNRIEAVILDTLKGLAVGQLPCFEVVSPLTQHTASWFASFFC